MTDPEPLINSGAAYGLVPRHLVYAGSLAASMGAWLPDVDLLKDIPEQFVTMGREVERMIDKEMDAAERADRPQAAIRTGLSEAEKQMLAFALSEAQEKVWSQDGFTDEDQQALDSLRTKARKVMEEEL